MTEAPACVSCRHMLQLSDTYCSMPIIVNEFVQHAVPEQELDIPQALEERCNLFLQRVPPDQLHPEVWWKLHPWPSFRRCRLPVLTQEPSAAVPEYWLFPSCTGLEEHPQVATPVASCQPCTQVQHHSQRCPPSLAWQGTLLQASVVQGWTDGELRVQYQRGTGAGAIRGPDERLTVRPLPLPPAGLFPLVRDSLPCPALPRLCKPLLHCTPPCGLVA